MGGGILGAQRAQTTYQSSATILVIPPGAGNPNATLNPFVNLDQNVSQLAQALSTRMNGPDVVSELVDSPDVVSFEAMVLADTTTSNATATSRVQLTAQATDPQIAHAVVQKAMLTADSELRNLQLQAGVTDKTLAVSVVLVGATPPEAMPTATARAAGIWAFSGFLIGLAITMIFVGVSRHFDFRDTKADASSTSSQINPMTGINSVSESAPEDPETSVSARTIDLEEDSSELLAESGDKPTALNDRTV
ncbi:hypothetical protein [Gordonia otitidis]|uniref:hypothetical protein n=1 Tax=Gordonia otitidis TaxID=249058 RepID=UPI000586E233|nr:hypothetical protein [Gordonia otitidis]